MNEAKPYHIIYGDKREIFKRYQITLDHLDSKLTEIASLKKMSAQNEYDMKAIKSKHQLAISLEMDSGNTPKFKNAEARSSELASRLRSNPDYKKLFDVEQSVKDQLIDADVKLQSLRALLKFYEVSM